MAKEKLDHGHYIEAVDRCHCINEIIDTILLQHPAIAQNATWKKDIEKAQELIGKVYQEIGRKT